MSEKDMIRPRPPKLIPDR